MPLPLHMGTLHWYESVIMLVVAFFPFILIAVIVIVLRRQEDPEEEGVAMDNTGDADTADPTRNER